MIINNATLSIIKDIYIVIWIHLLDNESDFAVQNKLSILQQIELRKKKKIQLLIIAFDQEANSTGGFYINVFRDCLEQPLVKSSKVACMSLEQYG